VRLLVDLVFDFMRRLAAASARLIAQSAGIIVGLTFGLWILFRHGTNPMRQKTPAANSSVRPDRFSDQVAATSTAND
jgi:hypothetical protein